MPIRHGNTYRALGWLAAASLCAALYVGEALGQVENDVPGESPESPAEAVAEQENPPTPPVIPSEPAEPAASPKIYEPDCDHPDSREEADLCAQRRMANAAEDTIKWIRLSVEWAESQYYATIGEIAALVVTILVAALAVGTAFRANRIARESAERQLRAYVCVTTIGLRFYSHRVRATTIATNHGTTPAYALRTQGGLMLCSFPSDTPFEPWNDSEEAVSVAIVGPEQPGEDFTEIAITNNQYDALRAGEMALYAFGEYRYKDAFKHDRFTKYRFMVGGDTGFNAETMSPCKEGNEAN